jgi:hypothetical protein
MQEEPRPSTAESEKSAPATIKRRLWWLLACATAGLGIGLLGHWLTSNPKWFLALPATLAVGWFFFADPEQCLSSCRKNNTCIKP